MKKQAIILTLFLISLIGFVSAVPLPHAFYGNVYYSDGNLIQESLEIRAEINETIVGTCDIVNGSYNLVTESESGGMIYFYIEGLTESIKSFDFKEFEITELNFHTSLQNPNQSITPPNNDSSSGDDGGTTGGGGGGGSSDFDLVSPESEQNDTISFSEAENNTNHKISLNRDESTNGAPITGAVTGVGDFVKSGAGALTLSVLVLTGLAVVTVLLRKRFAQKLSGETETE